MTITPLVRIAPVALILIATAASAQSGSFSPPPLSAPSAPAGSTAADDAATRSMAGERRWQTDAVREAEQPTPTRKGAARPAKPADLTNGATVADAKGEEIGYIKAVDSDGVVVATQTGQVKVPTDAFGKNSKGLLIGISKADFDKLVAQSAGG